MIFYAIPFFALSLTLLTSFYKYSIAKSFLADLTYIKETMDVLQTYGYATLAVILISLCSILGVFFHPCIDKPAYKYIMAVFVATAVGTMCGDAVLHLIPTAFGVHGGHSSEHNHHGHEKRLITIEPYFYKVSLLFQIVDISLT